MTPGRADGAPLQTTSAFRRAPCDWMFAFFARSAAYKTAYGATRRVRLRTKARLPHLTIWRYGTPNWGAETLGVRHWPASHRSSCPIKMTAFPVLAASACTARLTPCESADDPSALSLSRLKSLGDLVLAPNAPATLYLTLPRSDSGPSRSLQLILASSAPLLFGRFRLSVELALSDRSQETLTSLMALLGGGATSTPRLRLSPTRLATLERVYDLKAAGLSHRKIAICLYGEDRVRSDWRVDSYLKSRTARLVRQARQYVNTPNDLTR